MDQPQKNIALLIDADNASPDRLEDVLTVLAELGTVNIRRAYGNWEKTSLKGWKALTHRYAVEPQQQFDVTKGKSATDMKMIIDAMDLLFRGRVDAFGLMSSDSDFMPLVVRLKQDGLPVYGFGGAKTPESFRQACTRFIDVDQLASAAEPPAFLTTSAKAAAPPPKPAEIDDALLKVLGNAWKAAKRDERGYANLTEVGKLAGNQSSFDARSYGFSRLSELVAAIPQFTTEKREGVTFVRRVR